jgi:hypothetical protein
LRARERESAGAAVTVAWVIVANKPFYPLLVGWLAPAACGPSLWTLASLPVFLLVALRGEVHPLLRWLVPLVGGLDTLAATWAMGGGLGLEAFLAPCAALAALLSIEREKAFARGLLVFLFLAFVILQEATPAPIAGLDAEAMGRLRGMNLLSVAGLMFFIGWRFTAAPKPAIKA